MLEAMQPIMTRNNDAGYSVSTNTPQVGRCLLAAESLFPATTPFTLEQQSLPLPLSPRYGNPPKPQGKSLVPPLVDGWQQMCQARAREGAASDGILPFASRRSPRDYSARAREMPFRSPRDVHVPFMKACTLLNGKRVAAWQQRECSIKGSVSARTWGEYQEASLRQDRFPSNANRERILPLDQLPQRNSMWASCSDSVTVSSPMSAASVSSFASSAADLVPEMRDALLTGSCKANGAKQQGSSCKASPKQKDTATVQRFNISADDWAEMDEEFFPQRCPVLHECS